MENSPPQFTDVTNVTVFVEASADGYFTTTNSAALTITKAGNAWIAAPSMAGWTVGAAPATPNKGKAKFGTATVTYGVVGGAAGDAGDHGFSQGRADGEGGADARHGEDGGEDPEVEVGVGHWLATKGAKGRKNHAETQRDRGTEGF